MKFKELREATLSKTQIKKVHDKADDLPKNDFIKRYGKEGDAVRFATATNIVKKKLGIEDYEEGFKSDAQRRAAFASGYKEKGKKKDEAIKGNDFVGVSTSAREYIQGKQAAKDGKKYDDNPYKSGNREMNIRRLNWSAGHNKAREEYEVEEGFKNDAQRQAAVASLYSKLGLKGASKRSRDKAREKDKDSEKSKKKEEVEITEAISDAQVAQIARMTDRNDHFGVRIEIARLMKDKQLMSFYDSLEKMHMTSQIQNAIGNDAVSLRGKLEKVLKVRMKQRFGDKDSKRIMDAL